MILLLSEIKDREIRVEFDEATIVYTNLCFVDGFVNASGKIIQRVVNVKQVKGIHFHIFIYANMITFIQL